MKNKPLMKSLSVLLVLTFTTTNLYASQASNCISDNRSTLAPSLLSDPDINPERGDTLRQKITSTLEKLTVIHRPLVPAPARRSTSDTLVDHVIVEKDETKMGETTARHILDDMESALNIGKKYGQKVLMLWASAPSQHSTWKALLRMIEEDFAAGKLIREDMARLFMFHMDEYLGLRKGARQSFGTVLKKELFDKLKKFGLQEDHIYYFNGETEDADAEARRMIREFEDAEGRFDIVVGGIGEDSHVAFNSAPDARFKDNEVIKVVRLNEESRQQQVHDGEFDRLEDAPKKAITFTLPPIFAAKKIHIIIPRATKAEAVRNTLDSSEITEKIPATGLRWPDVLPNVTFYLDNNSASKSTVAQKAMRQKETNRASTSGIESDLPLCAAEFRTYLLKALEEAKIAGKNVVLAVDTDIGANQKAQIMPLYTAIDEIKNLKDAKGEVMFPNLIAIRGNGESLAKEITDMEKKDATDLNRVFIVAQNENVKEGVFNNISGEGRAWLAAIDDSSMEMDYMPVFESAVLMMMASLNADRSVIKDFYSRIAEKPLTPEALEDLFRNRVIYILPKITRFNPGELRKLYEAAHAAYVAA